MLDVLTFKTLHNYNKARSQAWWKASSEECDDECVQFCAGTCGGGASNSMVFCDFRPSTKTHWGGGQITVTPPTHKPSHESQGITQLWGRGP